MPANSRLTFFRFFVGLVLLGLGALLAGGLVLALRGGSRAVTLQNGLTLRCLGTSYGTNHIAYVGSTAGQILNRVLGLVFPRLRRNSPGLRTLTTPTPKLVAFFEEAGDASTNRTAPVSLNAMLVDERGVAAGDRAWIALPMGNSGPAWLLSPQFDLIPRRSRTLSIQFSTTGPDGRPELVGTLELPNPVFTNPPPFIAEPLPVSRTNGGLECRLEALVFGTGISSRLSSNADGSQTAGEDAASPGAEVRATAVFRFREQGTDTSSWTIGSLAVSDATGNAARAGSYSSHSIPNGMILTFGPVPWPGEPWRLDGWAKRTAAASYPPDELVTLRDVALPISGRTNQLEHAAKASGIELVVKGFCRRTPVAGGGYSSEDLSRLMLEVMELPEGAFVDLVRAEDDQGRALISDMTSTTHGTPLKMEFGFRSVPDDARTLSFTLAVHRGRLFTFLAQPQTVGTNGFEFTSQTPTSLRSE